MKKNKDVLIFNYSPNLKIVGTFHALNDRDKRTLEKLVNESDFVALEWDEFRSRIEGRYFLVRSEDRKRFSVEEDVIYCSKWDSIYLKLLGKAISRTVVKESESQGRNPYQEEFTLCEKLCAQKGKDVYLVDQPVNITYEKLCSLPIKDKSIELINSYLNKNFSSLADKILLDYRNEYMLQEIEKKEGCSILELKRKGLLVVGYSHAVKYWKDIQASLV